jgi:hypothetical protein
MLFAALLVCLPGASNPLESPLKTEITRVSGAVDYVDVYRNRITIVSVGKSLVIDIPAGTKIRINGEAYGLKDLGTIHTDVDAQATITILKGLVYAVEVEVRTKDGRWR